MDGLMLLGQNLVEATVLIACLMVGFFCSKYLYGVDVFV